MSGPVPVAWDLLIDADPDSTDAIGWVWFDEGHERVRFRAEGGATDRGTTYWLGSWEPVWWSDAPELDEWFDERWMEAAAVSGEEEFVERVTGRLDA